MSRIEIVRNRHQQIEVFGVNDRESDTDGGFVFGVKAYHHSKVADARDYATRLAAQTGVTVINDQVSK